MQPGSRTGKVVMIVVTVLIIFGLVASAVAYPVAS